MALLFGHLAQVSGCRNPEWQPVAWDAWRRDASLDSPMAHLVVGLHAVPEDVACQHPALARPLTLPAGSRPQVAVPHAAEQQQQDQQRQGQQQPASRSGSRENGVAGHGRQQGEQEMEQRSSESEQPQQSTAQQSGRPQGQGQQTEASSHALWAAAGDDGSSSGSPTHPDSQHAAQEGGPEEVGPADAAAEVVPNHAEHKKQEGAQEQQQLPPQPDSLARSLLPAQDLCSGPELLAALAALPGDTCPGRPVAAWHIATEQLHYVGASPAALCMPLWPSVLLQFGDGWYAWPPPPQQVRAGLCCRPGCVVGCHSPAHSGAVLLTPPHAWCHVCVVLVCGWMS